ncbi:MAG: Crp/Fnr family transcriptional regulator [Betaproteobacteria bacterium]|nr:Crp/Fnr family transcriptional regulator [Betaproteobacteria bacterium]
MPATPIKTQSFLANLPLFRELDPAEIDRLANGTREVHLARGGTLFRRGDPSEGFYAVVYGQIKLAFTSPSGAEKVVEIMGPGQSFGEAVMFMEKPYPVYTQALADSMLLHIARATVFAEIERDPKFARRMIAGLSRRLHNLITDLEAHTLLSGTQRVIGYLLRDEPQSPAPGKPIEVALPTSKTVIASRLNLTPEHFSRILHDLFEGGLIRVEGRSIVILDADALRRYEG